MTGSSDARADAGDYRVAVFLGVLAVVAAVVVFAAFRHQGPDTALVLATDQDCLRAFDRDACGQIVSNALAIHARTAPSFHSERVCEMSFGAGGCRPVKDSVFGGQAYAPKVAAILASRTGDRRDLLPLYFGKGAVKEDSARRVYFRGVAIGVLSQDKFGGAQISRIVDVNGKPISSGAVRKLRRS
jgi:uncharacterized protein YgiB involved in biofilm formation